MNNINRSNLPSLISQDYLNSVKTRLDNRSKLKFSFKTFCKSNHILILVFILLIVVCFWRYMLKSKGQLNNTNNKLINIQKKAAESVKKSLSSIKKKNSELNKPKFAIANDKKKLTKITNLPKQQYKPENNVTELPNLKPANSEAFFRANF
jgi:hypothetical protein